MNDLYLKDTYLNKNIDILSNKVIIEYDLHSANTSLCREYKLLPEDQIDKIENMKKDKRVVTIGKLQRKDKKFKEGLKEAFIDIRKRFFEENNIKDEDVLSIKKDAIFLLKPIKNTIIGKCEFVEKNRYSSYLYLKDIRLEIYYRNYMLKSVVDVKGISDDILSYHKDYIIDFFGKFFYKNETGTIKDVLMYIRRFVDKYKNDELDINYYREFNNISSIKSINGNEYMDPAYISDEDEIDKSYNFKNILIPIIQMMI